jgi:hypothetical protein
MDGLLIALSLLQSRDPPPAALMLAYEPNVIDPFREQVFRWCSPDLGAQRTKIVELEISHPAQNWAAFRSG